mmetsp:Transcript_47336/g.121804  ORF Transcript_47336/g.121804 Transcript_47336/m.121804 type:complete len:383 (+) Transcript_47336:62-1210(+)
MRHGASHTSVAASSLDESTASLFQRHLPQNIEAVEVCVPRGLRTPASPRIAGGLGGTCQSKTYCVVVEPNGRAKRPKEILREEVRPRTDFDVEVERGQVFSDAENGAGVDERIRFRRERLRHFQLGSHFPALVSPRLVPTWKRTLRDESSASEGFRDEASLPPIQPSQPSSARGVGSPRPVGSTLSKPTASHIQKQQVKRPENLAPPWHASGVAGAADLICDRVPSLHQDEYCPPSYATRHTEDDKELWMHGSTMLPVGVAAAKVSFDSNRPYVQSHIVAMRERGRAFNDDLQERYEHMRQNFQKEQQAIIERQGALSSFEQGFEREREEEARQLVKEREQTSKEVVGEKMAPKLSVLSALTSKKVARQRMGRTSSQLTTSP